MSQSDKVSEQGDLPLQGRIALITGAAQGIGLEVAQLLGESGAQLVVCDLPSERPASVDTLPGQAIYHSCDVSDFDAVQRTVKAVVDQAGALHILVNNAGIAIDGLLLRVKPQDWEKTLQVNLTGAFNFCRVAGKHLLRAKDTGRIVNISSVVGEVGRVGQVAYSASKAGLIGLTRTLAQEFGVRGVTVNAVAPGFIATRMTAEQISGEQREKLLQAIPLRRIGNAVDVAEAVRFLCLPAASYISGQVLRVNGGLYM